MKGGNGRVVVFIRHGHTEWNLTERFTGWHDIELSELGVAEAESAARRLAAASFRFDEAHVSSLRRTRQTVEAMSRAAGWPALPIHTSWRLNERHYGALQGMNKQEIFRRWGEESSRRWWRGYHEPPPSLSRDDPHHPRFDPLYADIDPLVLPAGESLRDCQQRLLPYWYEVLWPRLNRGVSLLVASHGNTLRALLMELEQIPAAAVEQLEIPSGVPLVYRFAPDGTLSGKEWLE